MMWASQLCLLDHFADHRPHLFLGHLRIWPEIFDRILDQISSHPIFHNDSDNCQAPVAIQLAVFLFCAGHYGNAASLEDVAQWAGFSMGSVVNFSNRVMMAILDEHDTFVNMPPPPPMTQRIWRELAPSLNHVHAPHGGTVCSLWTVHPFHSSKSPIYSGKHSMIENADIR